MIKRTLLFSSPAYLSCKKNQLVVSYPDDRHDASMPIEDIGVVILESQRITLSHALIGRLLANNAALITCDQHHLPHGLMLNLNGHSTQQAHMRAQVDASTARKNKLWKQTVAAKIRNQAALLRANGIPTENMIRWAGKTSSGDAENHEARAAAWYWQKIFVESIAAFKRGRSEDAPNNLLNYGYAILRGVIARALVGSGLLPVLGYHHRNKYNAYCLADDVMEPYRPYVDQLVLEIVRNHETVDELTTDIKKELLGIPALDVRINGKTKPLMLAAQHTTSSVVKCYTGSEKQIQFPVLEPA